MKGLIKFILKTSIFLSFFFISCTTHEKSQCGDDPFPLFCTYQLFIENDCYEQEGDIVSRQSCNNSKLNICLLEFIVIQQCKTKEKKDRESSSGGGFYSSGGSSSSGGGGGGGGGGSGGGGGN